MANRLSSSTSPYLLQLADNPVDWFEWGAIPREFASLRQANSITQDLEANCEEVTRRCREAQQQSARLCPLRGAVGGAEEKLGYEVQVVVGDVGSASVADPAE